MPKLKLETKVEKSTFLKEQFSFQRSTFKATVGNFSQEEVD